LLVLYNDIQNELKKVPIQDIGENNFKNISRQLNIVLRAIIERDWKFLLKIALIINTLNLFSIGENDDALVRHIDVMFREEFMRIFSEQGDKV